MHSSHVVPCSVDVHPLDIIVKDHQLEEWLKVRNH